jgi:G:T-mismatch repair DNA endonuclease (very short patch repair protein)
MKCQNCGRFIGKEEHKCPTISPCLGKRLAEEHKKKIGLALLGIPQFYNRRKDVDKRRGDVLDLYCNKLYSQGKIAKLMKCSWSVVNRILKENDIKLNSSNFYLKNNVGWSEGLTKETDERLKSMSKEKKGKHFSIKTEFKKGFIPHNKGKTKENYNPLKKVSERIHKKWENEEYAKKILKSIIKKPNVPESFLIELFEKNNVPLHYVGDGQLIVGGRCPDFVCNPSKKVVLLHGDYWHYLKPKKLSPLLTRERIEAEDKAHYRKYFFDALIIWEHELKNPNQVLNKIKEFLR